MRLCRSICMSRRLRRSAAALCLSVLPGVLWANGCIVVRPTSQLMLGLENVHETAARKWDYTVGYRYLYSDRHFRGDHEEGERQQERTDVRNEVHTFDHTVAYRHDERWRFSASLPLVYAERSSLYEHDRMNRHTMKASGIGDVRLMGYREMLAPASERGLTFGLGIKLPTGEKDAMDTAFTADGPEERTVDQSIQPGDGGTGLITELQAFRRVFDDRSYAFFTASYLVNPSNTNGVPTFRSRLSEAVMSVPDTYQARTGFARVLSERMGVAMDLALRAEGVPAEDLIGGSDGFRRPGYAIYVEPAVNVQRGKHRFNVSLPIAVERNRVRSVTDRQDGVHGDAAFADYLLMSTYSFSW